MQFQQVGPPAVQTFVGNGVDRKLPAVAGTVVRLFLVAHLGRLVVDDDHLAVPFVNPVPAPGDLVLALPEGELLLHKSGHCVRSLLALVEAPQALPPRLQTLLLMFATQKTLVSPGPLEARQQILVTHGQPSLPAAVVLLNRLVNGLPVDDRVVRPQRHAQDVDVLVLQRARQVVVHLHVA